MDTDRDYLWEALAIYEGTTMMLPRREHLIAVMEAFSGLHEIEVDRKLQQRDWERQIYDACDASDAAATGDYYDESGVFWSAEECPGRIPMRQIVRDSDGWLATFKVPRGGADFASSRISQAKEFLSRATWAYRTGTFYKHFFCPGDWADGLVAHWSFGTRGKS